MKKIIVLGIILTICLSSFVVLAQSTEGSGGTDALSHQYFMHLDGTDAPHFDQPFSSNDPLIVKDFWDSLFYRSTGYDSLIDRGLVTTFATDGDNLYVGGSFEFFDGIRCFNIIKYSRTSGIWSTLDSGLNGTVNVLKIHNGKLYAGGRFNGVGFYPNTSTPLGHIVVWDDAAKKWQQIGGGVDNSVTSIEFMDTSIIIGGYFQNADTTVPVSYIARWDSHTWDDMSGGVSNVVYTLLSVGDSLYVGGNFYSRSTMLSGVALYSGGNWQNLGDGVDGNVYALALYKGKIWIGGDFSSTSHALQQTYSLVVWDGNSLNAFGSGNDTGFLGKEVLSIVPVGDSIYIGGSFYSATGTLAHGIVKWNNNNFTPLSSGVYGEVHAIGAFNGSLYVGGTFPEAGNIPVNNIAKIVAGDIWKPIEATIGAIGGYNETYINAVVSTPQYVFIGGAFSTIAKKPFNHIAAWDKTNRKWIALGKGLDRDVFCLSIHDSNLYVGGDFNYAGDTLVHHIAYWDMNGKLWHSMGDGSPRYIGSIAANETGIYADFLFPLTYGAGLFDYIGVWDGSQWNPINNEINGYINAIAANGSTLYIGGQFDYINGLKVSHIAGYDGSNWFPLGTGVNNEVRSIVIADTNIYAGGYFDKAGTLPVYGIARWDGTNWNDLNAGLNSYTYALAWNGSSLYVGGHFTKTTGNVTTNYLAKWDGNTWSSVSSGTGADVYALAIDNAGLYVGGAFNHVNGLSLSSPRFGILHFASAGVSESTTNNPIVQNFPNPFTTETTITYSLAHDGLVTIEIYNLLGLKVKTVVNEFKAAGDYEVTADMKDLPSGTYLCKCTEGGVTQTKEINLVK
jgi:hypothetical protein